MGRNVFYKLRKYPSIFVFLVTLAKGMSELVDRSEKVKKTSFPLKELPEVGGLKYFCVDLEIYLLLLL